MGMVAEAWNSYERDVIPSGAPPVQRQETRRAFYAGARILLANLSASLDPDAEPTARDLVRLESIHQELERFLRDMQAGRV